MNKRICKDFKIAWTFESLIPADSRSSSGEQLRLQIHRNLLGSGPSRGRALSWHSSADQAESAAGPSHQASSKQAPQANPEASARVQEENQKLRESLRSLTYLRSFAHGEDNDFAGYRIFRAIAVSIGSKRNVRYLRRVLSIALTQTRNVSDKGRIGSAKQEYRAGSRGTDCMEEFARYVTKIVELLQKNKIWVSLHHTIPKRDFFIRRNVTRWIIKVKKINAKFCCETRIYMRK